MPMTSPIASANNLLRRIFRRLDTDHSNAITPANIKQVAKQSGAAKGPFGNQKAKAAAAEFIDTFDATGNNKVTYPEFVKMSSALLPGVELPDGTPVRPGTLRKPAQAAFIKIDKNGDGVIDMAELKEFIKAELQAEGELLPGVKAEAAARIMMYLINPDGQCVLTAEQVDALAADIERELARIEPKPEPTE